MLMFLLFLLLAIAPTQSEETSIEPEVLEQLQEQQTVPVIIQAEKPLDKLSFLEQIRATDVPLRHISENYYATEISEQELQNLLADPNIKTIEQDDVFTILLSDTVPLINASLVHARQMGAQNLTGKGQSVCVIDSGVNATHPGISGNIVAQKCFCSVTDLGGGGCCANTMDEDTIATDDNGHGTHVAGIIAANGTSALGVAPEAGIVAMKVTDVAGTALFSDITQAVSWCTNNASLYNITAISMSLGGGSYTSSCDDDFAALSEEIQNAFNKNITVVVATGNSGSTTNITAPACINKTIAVSSTTKADVISSFSNRNSITDMFAPGSSITSLSKNGGTETRSGTSMAAPHVAAVIALLQQYKQSTEHRPLTVTEINDTITTNGTTINDTTGSGRTFIRIDAFSSLRALLKGPIVTVYNPEDSRNTNNNSLTFDFLMTNTSATVNCTLLLNNTPNQSKMAANSVEEFRQNLSEGTYEWYISCKDADLLTENSTARTLTIDTTAPTFDAEQRNASLELGDNQSYAINVSDSYLESVNFSYNDENKTMTNTLTTFSYIFTPIIAGTNTYIVYAKDTAGNVNTTSGSFTTTDTITGPRITHVQYQNAVTQNDQQTITAWLFDALPMSEAYVNIGSGNVSMTNDSTYNFTYTFTATSCGAQVWSLFASNANNEGASLSNAYTITNCCGDGTCSATESCNTCSQDCGSCSSGGGGGSSGGGGGSSGGGSGGGGRESLRTSGTQSLATIKEETTEITQEAVSNEPQQQAPEEAPLEEVTGKGVTNQVKKEGSFLKFLVYSMLAIGVLAGIMLFLVREKKEEFK